MLTFAYHDNTITPRRFWMTLTLAICAAMAICSPVLAADGDLDTTFNTTGIVTTAIGSGADTGQAVALQSDGKIVVAGMSHNGSDNDFAVMRYNTDGTLDAGFGTGGQVTIDLGTATDDHAYAVAIQTDGKIIVAGGGGVA